MNHNRLFKQIPAILFLLTVTAFLSFFLYIAKNEKIDIQHTNPAHGYTVFSVLLTDTNRAHLDLQIDKLLCEKDKYNAEHPELPIHFAWGAVLSSDHPGASRNDLFRLADEEMYRNKKAWYENR